MASKFRSSAHQTGAPKSNTNHLHLLCRFILTSVQNIQNSTITPAYTLSFVPHCSYYSRNLQQKNNLVIQVNVSRKTTHKINRQKTFLR